MSGIATYADVLSIESQGGLDNLPASTYEMIRISAHSNPQAPALSFFLRAQDHTDPETWTYSELLHRIHQTANFFHKLGGQKETVIAYVLPNLPETHLVIWGGEATGIVFAINPLLEPSAIADLLNVSGATILVTLAPFPGTEIWAKLHGVLFQVSTLQHLVLVNLADHLAGVRGIAASILQKWETVRLHGVFGVKSAIPDTVQVHDFNKAIQKESESALNSGRLFKPNDISSYFCTGGTTGLPKIAARTHGNEVHNACSSAQFIGDSVGPGKNIFCGLPLFHVNAVLVTGLVPFYRGAHVILGTPQGYRGDGVIQKFWEIVDFHRINFFSGVPTLYASLLQVPIGDYRIDSLEYGLCGAAPLPIEIYRSFQERTGLKILEGYGLTEATCVSAVNPPMGQRRPGSIGLRVPGQEMKVVELDENGCYLRDCEIDEVGIIAIAGPNVFHGYKLAEQNKNVWIIDADGRVWLNTGDLGRQDADSYFWLTGRKKELIIRGGHNIDPASIEGPLHRHPAVELAAAVGRPDAYAGEVPVAYVQLKKNANCSSDRLMNFVREQIAERAAIPKSIHIVDQIPLTAVGKIYKPALRIREVQSALESSLQDSGVFYKCLEVVDDRSLGTVVRVALVLPHEEERVRYVLGRFPFPVSVIDSNDGTLSAALN